MPKVRGTRLVTYGLLAGIISALIGSPFLAYAQTGFNYKLKDVTVTYEEGAESKLVARFKIADYPHERGIQFNVRMIVNGKHVKPDEGIRSDRGKPNYADSVYTMQRPFTATGTAALSVQVVLFHKQTIAFWDAGTEKDRVTVTAKRPGLPKLAEIKAYDMLDSEGKTKIGLDWKFVPETWRRDLQLIVTDNAGTKYLDLGNPAQAGKQNTFVVPKTARTQLSATIKDRGQSIGSAVNFMYTPGNSKATITLSTNVDTVANSDGTKGATVAITGPDGVAKSPKDYGAEKNTTPLTFTIPLTNQKHTITFTKEGYTTASATNITFDRPVTLAKVLTKEGDTTTTVISARSHPDGPGSAKLFIDGVEIGRTPVDVTRPRDTKPHTITLRTDTNQEKVYADQKFDKPKLEFYYNFVHNTERDYDEVYEEKQAESEQNGQNGEGLELVGCFEKHLASFKFDFSGFVVCSANNALVTVQYGILKLASAVPL